MSIQNEVNRWLASPAGKKRVAEARQKAMQEGRSFGQVKSGVCVDRRLAAQYAEDMMQSILDKLPASLRDSLEHPISRESFNDPVIQVNGDNFHIFISFREDAVHRESLRSDVGEWKNGIENIVVHLHNGWAAKGTVQGIWNGHAQRSRQKYAGNDFMTAAITEFNGIHKQAKATLGPAYRR